MTYKGKRFLLVYTAMCLLFLVPLVLHGASGQNYIVYKVQVNIDGSALWMITQFSNINDTIDTWEGFQEKVFNLVDNSASATHREMTIDENSLQINTAISSESKTTEYVFKWLNFSIIDNDKIIFGDVLSTPNFFGQLYGDASLQISYPLNYSIKLDESNFSTPYEQNDQEKTLRWARTQDLVNGNLKITLSKAVSTGNGSGADWQSYAIIAAVSATATALFFVVFYLLRRLRVNGKQTAVISPEFSLESEEEKVIKILGVSGGSMRQSAITEQCRFSKAKTSQLLAVLEKKGIVTRYKRGRDKIVILKERA